MNIEAYLNEGILFIPAVVGYLITDTKVLLGRRKKVSFGLGADLIAGIGGKVGDSPEIENETNEEALAREVLEEIEVTITSFSEVGHVRFIFPNNPKWNQSVTVYLITQWLGEPKETEAIKPIWFDKASLPTAQMWDDNLYWLPKVLAGKKVKGIFLSGDNNKVIEHTLTEED